MLEQQHLVAFVLTGETPSADGNSTFCAIHKPARFEPVNVLAPQFKVIFCGPTAYCQQAFELLAVLTIKQQTVLCDLRAIAMQIFHKRIWSVYRSSTCCCAGLSLPNFSSMRSERPTLILCSITSSIGVRPSTLTARQSLLGDPMAQICR